MVNRYLLFTQINTLIGNYISDSIHDRHILNNICDLYQRGNLLISQFRSCDSETLDKLHKTYYMHNCTCMAVNYGI